MALNDFEMQEVDERAFAIFLIEGIQYYLDQDPRLHQASLIEFCIRLWNRWDRMDDIEKHEFHERAREELRRLRRYRHVDIYRDLMRNDRPEQQQQQQSRQTLLQRRSLRLSPSP